MNSPELKKLIELLDFPDQLKLIIEKNRAYKDLDESIRGFIAMYDSFDGDCAKMKNQMAANKNDILKSLIKPKKSIFTQKFIRYAAIFVVIIASSFFVYAYLSNNRIELSARYNDPGIPNFMSTEENNEMSTIMFYYQKKNYQKADALIQAALKQKPSNDTLNYYASVLLYMDESGDSGMKGFEKLSKGSGAFKAKSMYYQGMIFVEQKNYTMAIKRFKEVLLLDDEAVSLYAKAHIKQLELYQKSK
jgi:tetratricopeptide (TPR) repeat protein